ncbi:MAG: FAD-dependent oxidoreductase, partial [Rubrivivax sp.]|nr:FAD-dependent oxidoreductase [Rubrivivax sp.]
RRVVVVGGGSAALDTARSARRLGHEVTVLALEAREQLPAQRDEVDEALDEGIRLVDGAMLQHAVAERDFAEDHDSERASDRAGQRARVREEERGRGREEECEREREQDHEQVRSRSLERHAAQDGGRASLRLHCRRVRFVPGTARGAFTLEPLAGSDFELEADALLSSIGQEPELEPFGATLPRDGTLLAVDAHGATGEPGVWAGGDVASLGRFFTEAVGMGRRAALAMHAQLLAAAGETDETDEPAPAQGAAPRPRAVAAGDIATWYHAPARRAAARQLPPGARRLGFDEVQLGLEPGAALAEAARCFSCGTCIACDNCITVCPDLAVHHACGGGYEVLGDYCKGCGLCVRECPTGSMAMHEECR